MADDLRDRQGKIDRTVDSIVRGNEVRVAQAAPQAPSVQAVDAALAKAAAAKGAPLTAAERLRIRQQMAQKGSGQ